MGPARRAIPMNWLKEIRTTIVEAFTARQVFVTGSIGVAAGLVVSFVPRISFDGQPVLLGVPAWAWGVIVWLVGLLWFALGYAHRKRLELVPTFQLSFDPQECVAVTPTVIGRFGLNGMFEQVAESQGSYVRVKITAPKADVRGCAVFITAIEKMNTESGIFFPMVLQTPILLTPEPIVVYSNIPRFVDVVMVGESDNIVNLPPGSPLAFKGKFQEKTSYRFTISVAANSVTKTRRVLVRWPGNWDGISAVSGD
jgi:hypothetical protein